MASLLYRLGHAAYRRWPIFIAAWAIVLVGFGAVAVGVSKPMVDKFSIPGISTLR